MSTENHELLKIIYNTAVDSIITINEDGMILFCNQSTERMFGYPLEELSGKNVGILLPTYLEEIKIINSGKRLSAQKKGGAIFPISLTISAVKIDHRQAFIGIVRDISKITLVEESLLKRSIDLERSNLELEEFAYVASHDLQAPLRVISNYAEILVKNNQGKLDQNTDNLMTFILNSSKKMQALVKNLLLLSRVGSHDQELSNTSLEDVLTQALKNLELNIEESKMKVTHESLPTVTADEKQLVQLFQNLIGNAIKFRAQTDPKIHISVRSENNKWLFFVEDNGIGIPSGHLESIFVIFNQLKERSQYPGTGIGLSICKKIVERHGGTIWVESNPGQGSKFFFTLSINNTKSKNTATS